MKDKIDRIKAQCLSESSKDPVEIAIRLMKMSVIDLHGPEHHFLDGAAFLTAYKNSGGLLNIEKALVLLAERSSQMPGAMCGYWGVCGSSTSVGAALSIIHGTSPMSGDEFYKDNMEFTSEAIRRIGSIGGPRCCKRNAFLSLMAAASFVKRKYGINMMVKPFVCDFADLNETCIKMKCPFFRSIAYKNKTPN